jgi:hypothetical protein
MAGWNGLPSSITAGSNYSTMAAASIFTDSNGTAGRMYTSGGLSGTWKWMAASTPQSGISEVAGVMCRVS